MGCNVGVFTVFAAKTAKRVIAIDALSKFLLALNENLIRNRCINSVSAKLALIGSRSGVFNIGEALRRNPFFEDTPPKLTMLDVCRLYELKKIDFLKIDIEGSEFDLLTNNNEWLKNVDKIAMEVHQDFGALSSITEVLTKFDFKIWLRNKNGSFVDELSDPIGYLYACKKSIVSIQ
jgi:FkbM family methyltransferase